MSARIGILTVSDRASRGEYEDRSGPAIEELLKETLTSEWEPVYRVVPDEREAIEAALTSMADDDGCCLVVTTGGTGPALPSASPARMPSSPSRLCAGSPQGRVPGSSTGR